MTLDKRTIRTAPQQHFNGAYVGHGPLVSDLPPLRPVREALVVGFAIAVFFALIWGFAAMTPSDQETAKEALVGAQRAGVS